MRSLMCALVAMGAMCLQAEAQTAKPAVGSEEVYWVVTFSIPQGQMEKFKQVVAQLVAETKKEPGTLEYEYTENSDHSTVDIIERYSNSDAVVHHVTQTFAKYSKPFLENAKVGRFIVYGTPNAEAKKALAGFNPVYFTPFDGFTR
jgi:quinol monooxygenase YgiN